MKYESLAQLQADKPALKQFRRSHLKALAYVKRKHRMPLKARKRKQYNRLANKWRKPVIKILLGFKF